MQARSEQLMNYERILSGCDPKKLFAKQLFRQNHPEGEESNKSSGGNDS